MVDVLKDIGTMEERLEPMAKEEVEWPTSANDVGAKLAENGARVLSGGCGNGEETTPECQGDFVGGLACLWCEQNHDATIVCSQASSASYCTSSPLQYGHADANNADRKEFQLGHSEAHHDGPRSVLEPFHRANRVTGRVPIATGEQGDCFGIGRSGNKDDCCGANKAPK